MAPQHLLILGATGATGLEFINHVSTLPTPPKLTLYVRNSSRLPSVAQNNPNMRIITGSLSDSKTLSTALDGDDKSGKVTAVISFLGAYVSLWHFLLRTRPTPIADAFASTLLPLMKSHNIPRILALSTGNFPHPRDQLGWGMWLFLCVPPFVVPQGCAEMVGIARNITTFAKEWPELEYTIFRVPHLNLGDKTLPVLGGYLGAEYKGSLELSRGSLARWTLEEVEGREWVGESPYVAN